MGYLITFIAGGMFGVFIMGVSCGNKIHEVSEEAYDNGFADGLKEEKMDNFLDKTCGHFWPNGQNF